MNKSLAAILFFANIGFMCNSASNGEFGWALLSLAGAIASASTLLGHPDV